MARVLMSWELGNGLPYIEGLAAMARWSEKQGAKHEYLFALRDLGHAERVLGKRFPYFQAPTQVLPMGMQLASPMTFADVLINLGFGDAANVVARVRAWRNLLGYVKPDILRAGHAPGALLAARGTGIRTVFSGIGFLLPPPLQPLPKLRTWSTNAVPERMAAREARVLSAMNQALDAVGAPQLATVAALYDEVDIRELYTYPELDDYGARERVEYLGSVQAAAGETPAWPDAPGKRIFAYLEPYEPVAAVLQALASTRLPTLVYMSRVPDPLRKRYAGSNLLLTDRPINVPEAAARCDLGVNHGGHNIVASLLQAGKPQLCLPALFPEKITALKVAGLDAGLTTRMQAEEFGPALSRLLEDPSFATKAQECGARLRHYTLAYAMQGSLESVEKLAAKA